jgi:hypothetical protein
MTKDAIANCVPGSRITILGGRAFNRNSEAIINSVP